jgi:hypothetical protein
MSDLTRFRDYCRKRARGDHDEAHKALWRLLADEVDTYLAEGAESAPDTTTAVLW